jgi:molybdopterin adenylyltransferase
MSIDTSRNFVPLHIAVCTISDTRTLENDTSGGFLCDILQQKNHILQDRSIICDDINQIVEQLETWISQDNIDVILCTGGTGLTDRDVTPEALQKVVDKWIPGFGELFRYLSFQKIGTSTIQSRACAGSAKGKLIFALPGSTSACRDAWNDILEYQLDIRHRPCNFAEILPRMKGSALSRK